MTSPDETKLMPDEIFIDTDLSDNRYSLKNKEHRTRYTLNPTPNSEAVERLKWALRECQQIIYEITDNPCEFVTDALHLLSGDGKKGD